MSLNKYQILNKENSVAMLIFRNYTATDVANYPTNVISERTSKTNNSINKILSLSTSIFDNYGCRSSNRKNKIINTYSIKYMLLQEKSKRLEIEFNETYDELMCFCIKVRQEFNSKMDKLKNDEIELESLDAQREDYFDYYSIFLQSISNESDEIEKQLNDVFKLEKLLVYEKESCNLTGKPFSKKLESKLESANSIKKEVKNDLKNIFTIIYRKKMLFDESILGIKFRQRQIEIEEEERIYIEEMNEPVLHREKEIRKELHALKMQLCDWIIFLKRLYKKISFAGDENNYLLRIDDFIKLIEKTESNVCELHSKFDLINDLSKIKNELDGFYHECNEIHSNIREFYFLDKVVSADKPGKIILRKVSLLTTDLNSFDLEAENLLSRLEYSEERGEIILKMINLLIKILHFHKKIVLNKKETGERNDFIQILNTFILKADQFKSEAKQQKATLLKNLVENLSTFGLECKNLLHGIQSFYMKEILDEEEQISWTKFYIRKAKRSQIQATDDIIQVSEAKRQAIHDKVMKKEIKRLGIDDEQGRETKIQAIDDVIQKAEAQIKKAEAKIQQLETKLQKVHFRREQECKNIQQKSGVLINELKYQAINLQKKEEDCIIKQRLINACLTLALKLNRLKREIQDIASSQNVVAMRYRFFDLFIEYNDLILKIKLLNSQNLTPCNLK